MHYFFSLQNVLFLPTVTRNIIWLPKFAVVTLYAISGNRVTSMDSSGF